MLFKSPKHLLSVRHAVAFHGRQQRMLSAFSAAALKVQCKEFIILLNVFIVEHVSAFGAEFRRVRRICGFPAAFVAAVQRCVRRLFCTAV